jgi:hypothetical protein
MLTATAASTNHDPEPPSAAQATPLTKKIPGPSSASARAAARQTETYETIARDVRTTRMRSDVGNLLMATLDGDSIVPARERGGQSGRAVSTFYDFLKRSSSDMRAAT